MVIGLVTTLVFLYLAGKSVESTWTYYTILKFQWDETWVGYSLGVVGVLVAIVQGGLIRTVIPKLGAKKSIFIGLSLMIVGLILFAFASKGWMMMSFLIPYCLGGIAGPALQGVISNEVPANEQGELQGALTSLMSLTAIVGPLIMNNLFSFCTKPGTAFYFPGAPFALGALLLLIGTLLAIRSLKNH